MSLEIREKMNPKAAGLVMSGNHKEPEQVQFIIH